MKPPPLEIPAQVPRMNPPPRLNVLNVRISSGYLSEPRKKSIFLQSPKKPHQKLK